MKILQLSKKQRVINKNRKKIFGTADRPRLAVNRSNKFIYAQLIDDQKSVTIFSAKSLADKKDKPMEEAKKVGIEIAKKAVEAGIKECVFDRRSYKYHGRVKSLADGAREAGLKF